MSYVTATYYNCIAVKLSIVPDVRARRSQHLGLLNRTDPVRLRTYLVVARSRG